MPPTPGAETPPIVFRQPRIQIPSVLPSLLQTELLFLDRLLRKNKPQHRSSVFFQKSTHVLRLAKRLAAVIDEVVKVNETGSTSVAETLGRTIFANGDKIVRESRGEGKVQCHYKILVELVDKLIPAITKASDVLEKMINHLHFLPLITTLLAITSRIFIITVDVGAYLMQYRDVTQNANGSGSSTPIPSVKDKDKVSFNFEEVVDMVVRGKMTSSRVVTAQEQLDSRLKAITQQASQEKGKARFTLDTEGDTSVLLEMEGEDFGEAVGEPIARASPPRAVRKDAPSRTAPIVIDPPSSPDEPHTVPSFASAPPTPSFSLNIDEPITGEKVGGFGEAASTFATPAEQMMQKPFTAGKKRAERPIESSGPAEPAPPKKKTSGERKPARQASTADKVKIKKKKGKDAMDDIFGL